jgi:hypothetical protein
MYETHGVQQIGCHNYQIGFLTTISNPSPIIVIPSPLHAKCPSKNNSKLIIEVVPNAIEK